jgi:hypothetical protein
MISPPRSVRPVIPLSARRFFFLKPKAQGKPFFLFIFAFNVAFFVVCASTCLAFSTAGARAKGKRQRASGKVCDVKVKIIAPHPSQSRFRLPLLLPYRSSVSMVTVVKSAMIVIKAFAAFQIIFYSS